MCMHMDMDMCMHMDMCMDMDMCMRMCMRMCMCMYVHVPFQAGQALGLAGCCAVWHAREPV